MAPNGWTVSVSLLVLGAALIILIAVELLTNPSESGGKRVKRKLQSRMKKRDVAGKGEKVDREKRQNTNIGDQSQLPEEVASSSLPTLLDKVTTNDRYMPTLSNGQIGVTVYNDSLYVNGLYSGAGGQSHRAKIPALVMLRVNFSRVVTYTTRNYYLNAKQGIFKEVIDCDFATITHTTYVHQKYIRVLVSDIYAVRKPSQLGGGIIYLNYVPISNNSDIRWDNPQVVYSNWEMHGRTVQAEAGVNPQDVYVFYMELQNQIALTGSTLSENQTIIMAVDVNEGDARADFNMALTVLQTLGTNGSYMLLWEHMNVWAKTWEAGLVEITGDLIASKIAWFSQYYLLSNMPSLYPYQPPQRSYPFFGLGRDSLARGGPGKDYQGHVFWDSEMYCLPAVVLFYPTIAKKFLRYRSYTAGAAQAYAQASSQTGYRYPWESAYSGGDVTPDNCTACRTGGLHITAAVNWAIRQYWSATNDRDIMTNVDYNSCDVTRETARFFYGLGVYNSSKGRYDINNVVGPDDYNQNINNNAYTNAAGSLAIHWARYFACLCNRNERVEVPDTWLQTALYLSLPFDTIRRVNYEYEGFQNSQNQTIKQADAILLGYPLNFNMSVDIQYNDLYFYEKMYSAKTPAMTYSFMTIGWKWVNQMDKVLQYFRASYQNYVIQPFKIWTEFNEQNMADQAAGSVNFIPGMGGFMQSLIYGFAGIRLRPQALEFHNPIPPPGSNTLKLTNLTYLGTSFTVEIATGSAKITVLNVSQAIPLLLQMNSTSTLPTAVPFTLGVYPITNPSAGWFIYPAIGVSCDHPRDYIYMPWGYSPWISRASKCQSAFALSLLMTAFVSAYRWATQFTPS